ncbi:MAG: ABC transporter permease [Rhizobiales bacterium]|nr:ABC transporter permease [Hyphomicrobiales bacterium]
MTAEPTTSVHSPSGSEAAPRRPRWQTILFQPVMMTVVLLILEPIVAGIFWPQSLDFGYILSTFTLTAPLALMALVLTLVIIAGEIDLSPASTMALTACVFAWVLQAGVPFPVAVLVCTGLGLLLGLFNAFLVVFLRLPSLIATIGTLTFYRGLAQVLAGDKSIKLPEWYMGLDLIKIAGIPVPDLMVTVAAIVLALVLGGTIFGRQIYQTGTNEVAARYAGIRTRRIKTVLFAALGLTSALAGMMFTSQLGTVRYDLGLGGELQMVLMAMLGGTYIFGGRGSILGTFLAAWLLSIMTNAMNTASWLPATQFCLLGVLLIVSIIATNFIYSRTQR